MANGTVSITYKFTVFEQHGELGPSSVVLVACTFFRFSASTFPNHCRSLRDMLEGEAVIREKIWAGTSCLTDALEQRKLLNSVNFRVS